MFDQDLAHVREGDLEGRGLTPVQRGRFAALLRVPILHARARAHTHTHTHTHTHLHSVSASARARARGNEIAPSTRTRRPTERGAYEGGASSDQYLTIFDHC